MTYAPHRYADTYPLMVGTEFAELEADIAQHGLREPIWLHGGEILDGRNRYAACRGAGVPPTFRDFHGSDDEALAFVISMNAHRRHLNAGQRAICGVKIEGFYAEIAARNVGGRPRADSKPVADRPQVSSPDEPPRRRAPLARDLAARATKSSGRSVARAKRLMQEAPDLAAKVEAGWMPLDRAERVVRDRVAEARRVEQARREAAAGEVATTVDIRHGDFREALDDLSDVDAVITDPPYPREFLPLLADLAAFADRVLKPDGVLAVLFGQAYLPDVYRLLEGGRPYRWTGCYLTSGAGYSPHGARIRVQSNWKPLLVYGGGPRFADVIRSEGGDADSKNNHKWGQDYGAFHTIVERLTVRGQTVVDPFMGAGTTLLAAHALGRHTVGCDTDPESVTTAKRRLLP